MTEQEIYDGVIMSGTTDFAFVVETLRRHGAGWCVIGGLAVNSYTTPVYTADLDLVVAKNDLEPVLVSLHAASFRLERFACRINAQRPCERTGPPNHRLRARFTTPGRYQPFLDRASLRPIFGLEVPVATLADVTLSELWTRDDPARRYSACLLAEMNLFRLAEAHFAEVAPLLPADLRATVEASPARGEDGWGDDTWEDDDDLASS